MIGFIIAGLMVHASGTDLRERMISNWTAFLLAACTLWVYPEHVLYGAASALSLFGIHLLTRGAFGMGDVKLSFGLGVIAGGFFLTMFAVAGVFAFYVYRKKGSTIPLAPFLCGGAIIAWELHTWLG